MCPCSFAVAVAVDEEDLDEKRDNFEDLEGLEALEEELQGRSFLPI